MLIISEVKELQEQKWRSANFEDAENNLSGQLIADLISEAAENKPDIMLASVVTPVFLWPECPASVNTKLLRTTHS